MVTTSLLSFALLLAAPPALAQPSAIPDAAPAPGTAVRVAGDRAARTVLRDGRFSSGASIVEESLPAGYPAPTPPGAIELKTYPSVRRAQVSGAGNPDRGTSAGFFPLFQHIQERGIAMTSPVEVDLPGLEAGEDGVPDGWTMAFLYRAPDLGDTGRAGRVEVVDAAPVTVVSIGVQGPYGMGTVRTGLRRVEAWLAEQQGWERAGAPRALYYNGPYVPDERKWAEVQVPVRSRGSGTTTGGAGSPDVVDVALDAGTFGTLGAALDAAGLVDVLRGDGPFTVLAPTDAAFAKLGEAAIADLLRPESRARLASILTYHVVPGRLRAADLLQARSARTVQGAAVTVRLEDGRLRVGPATVVANDVLAANGVIHVIDTVLIPPAPSAAAPAATPSVTSLIELAIERGAPLYNDGQPAACAAVYEVLARCLLAMPHDRIAAGERSALAAALAALPREHDPRERAWVLRRALDRVYAARSGA